jgi:hypothetical protein
LIIWLLLAAVAAEPLLLAAAVVAQADLELAQDFL